MDGGEEMGSEDESDYEDLVSLKDAAEGHLSKTTIV